jgi:hypothetical protein
MGDAMDAPDVVYPVPDIPARRVERNVKEPCSECGKAIAVGYMRTHLREIHGITLPPSKRGRKAKKIEPLEADDVVAVMLKALFPKGIPGAQVEEVFVAVLRYRDHTEEFLREVQRG